MNKIPKIAILRLALYAKNLEILAKQGAEVVSSQALADLCGANSSQIRKDLAYFGQFGTRGLGYRVRELLGDIKKILGTDREWRLGLVGVGNLGRALLRHSPFAGRGFVFVAAFDEDPLILGASVGGVTVSHMKDLKETRKAACFDIGVLATGERGAQACADRLVNAGVRAILNFTPVILQVPPEIFVENVDFSLRLDVLCHALTRNKAETCPR
jgi:redox-sensing transcriptional repressor